MKKRNNGSPSFLAGPLAPQAKRQKVRDDGVDSGKKSVKALIEELTAPTESLELDFIGVEEKLVNECMALLSKKVFLKRLKLSFDFRTFFSDFSYDGWGKVKHLYSMSLYELTICVQDTSIDEGVGNYYKSSRTNYGVIMQFEDVLKKMLGCRSLLKCNLIMVPAQLSSIIKRVHDVKKELGYRLAINLKAITIMTEVRCQVGGINILPEVKARGLQHDSLSSNGLLLQPLASQLDQVTSRVHDMIKYIDQCLMTGASQLPAMNVLLRELTGRLDAICDQYPKYFLKKNRASGLEQLMVYLDKRIYSYLIFGLDKALLEVGLLGCSQPKEVQVKKISFIEQAADQAAHLVGALNISDQVNIFDKLAKLRFMFRGAVYDEVKMKQPAGEDEYWNTLIDGIAFTARNIELSGDNLKRDLNLLRQALPPKPGQESSEQEYNIRLCRRLIEQYFKDSGLKEFSGSDAVLNCFDQLCDRIWLRHRFRGSFKPRTLKAEFEMETLKNSHQQVIGLLDEESDSQCTTERMIYHLCKSSPLHYLKQWHDSSVLSRLKKVADGFDKLNGVDESKLNVTKKTETVISYGNVLRQQLPPVSSLRFVGSQPEKDEGSSPKELFWEELGDIPMPGL